jgi:hypothetical protein
MPGQATGGEAKKVLGEGAFFGTEEFLFVFVSLAFAISIREVFPSVYGALAALYKYYLSLPDIGVVPTVRMVFGSRNHFRMLLPYFESVALSVVVFGLWVGYYFLMATVRRHNWIGYAPFYMMIDLGQAVLLYLTARSLTNFTAKPIDEPDPVWCGVVLILIVGLIRLWLAMFNIRSREGEGEIIRGHRWVRIVMRVVHIDIVLLSIAVFGLLYGHATLDLRNVVRAVMTGCVCYVIGVGATGVLVRAIVRSECGLSRLDTAEALVWAWRREGRWMLCGVIVSVALQCSAWLGVWRSWTWGLSFRDMIPTSSLLALGLMIGGGAVTQWGGTPMISHVIRKGPYALMRTTLKQHRDYAGCVGQAKPTFVVFADVNERGGPKRMARAGRLPRRVDDELAKVARIVLERSAREPGDPALKGLLAHGVQDIGASPFPGVTPGFDRPMIGLLCKTDAEVSSRGILFVLLNRKSTQIVYNQRFIRIIGPLAWFLAQQLQVYTIGKAN